MPLKCDHCIVAYRVYIVYRIAGSKSLEGVFEARPFEKKKTKEQWNLDKSDFSIENFEIEHFDDLVDQ